MQVALELLKTFLSLFLLSKDFQARGAQDLSEDKLNSSKEDFEKLLLFS
jgi:sulfur transfer complex TusBCD TusB component (DsrH family)